MRTCMLFAMLLSASVIADDTLIYEGWFRSSENVVINSVDYSFLVYQNGDRLVTYFGDDHLIIDFGACETDNRIRFCFNDTDQDDSDSTLAYVKIYELDSTIDIDRSASDLTPVVGDEITIAVTLTNDGSSTALGLEYVEDMPSGLNIVACYSCEKENDKAVWRGFLDSGESTTFSYDLLVMDEIDVYLKGDLIQPLGNYEETFQSESIHLVSEPFVDTIHSFNRTSVHIGDTVEFYLNISNMASERIDLEEVSIVFPRSMEVVERPSRLTYKGGYKESFTLSHGSNRSYEFVIRPRREGNMDIIVHLAAKRDGMLTEKSILIPVDIDSVDLKITSSIDGGKVLDPYEETELKFYVENQYEEAYLYDLEAKVNSSLIYVEPSMIDVLPAGSKKKIVDVAFFSPVSNKSEAYPVVINVTYRNEHGDIYSESLSRTFYSKPTYDLEVEQVLSSSTVEEGRDVTMKVQVSNRNERNLTAVDVRDITDPGLKIAGVSSRIYRDLASSSTSTAYSYTITAPKVSSPTNFTISTMIRYDDQGVRKTDQEQINLTVKPKKIDVELKRSADPTLYMGRRTTYDYSVENKDEEDVFDLTITFPKTQDLDILGDAEYEISRLGAGEKLVLEGLEWSLPKAEGQISPISILTYSDSDGNVFETNSTPRTYTVRSNIIQRPAIIIVRDAKHSEGYAQVEINITNVGGEPAEGILVDGDQKFPFELAAGENSSFSYRLAAESNMTLERAVALYDFQGEEIRAYSEETDVAVEEVSAPEPEKMMAPAVEMLNDTEKSYVFRKVEPEQEEKKRNVFVAIAEFIKKLLFRE